MANPEHLEILRQGVEVWNAWRTKEPLIEPDLSGANLSGARLYRADLTQANLFEANLGGADLSGAYLYRANLSRADLSEANLAAANLGTAGLAGANLYRADLSKASLAAANLGRAYLDRANLSRADLNWAQLVDTNFVDATLTDCSIYGISAWDVRLSEGTKQQGLIITPRDEPAVIVDDLEVAQFIYLLLHNEKLRKVIDTVGKKGVLLLGRFEEIEDREV
jgi:uncharacterized protein YjbI with pentapeptide repeats